MGRKPPIVIITIVLSALMLMPATMGLYGAIWSWRLTESGEISVVDFAVHLARTAATFLLAAATLYAGFRRPAWGHVVTILFAAFIATLLLMGILHPDPHPLLPLRNEAESLGARIGQILVLAAAVAYLGYLIFGRNARGYYCKQKSPADA